MTLNLTKKVSLPDMPSVSTPDIGHITDELMDLAGAAADAVSSAAGHVPGLDDYRAAARRRRMLSIVGAVVIVLAVAVVVRRRRQDHDVAQATAHAR
jgi:hypothetical protein